MILTKIAQKLIKRHDDAPYKSYKIFRILFYIKLQNDFVLYDKLIKGYQEIATKVYLRRFFINDITNFLAYSLCLLNAIFLPLSKINPLIDVFCMIFCIFLINVIGHIYYLNYKNKFPISTIVMDIIYIVIILLGFKEGMLGNLLSNLEFEKKKTLLSVIEEHPISSQEQAQKSTKSNLYGDLQGRRIILKSIEEIAKCFESRITSQLHSGDAITDEWFSNSMKQIAAALRDKKKWVLTPKEDTYDNLITVLISTLIHIVSDNWDALERVEPKEITKTISFRMFLFSLLSLFRTFFIASLPLLGFIIFELTPFRMNSPFRDYIFSGTLLWLGLTILMRIDSDVNDKITILKDIRTLISTKE